MDGVSAQYVAGFFDGEGTVGLYKQDQTKRICYFRPYMAINLKNDSRNMAVLRLIAAKYGGKVYQRGRICRVQWLKLAAIRAVIADILPYTIIKTTQLVLLDSWLETQTYGFRVHQLLKSQKRRE